MSAQTRRTVILLAQIPLNGKLKLTLQRRQLAVGILTNVDSEKDAEMGEVSIDRNTVIFRTTYSTTSTDQAIPLDDIEAVWRGGDNVWCVRIAGYFEPHTNNHGDVEVSYRAALSG
jgi:hypothetical protein